MPPQSKSPITARVKSPPPTATKHSTLSRSSRNVCEQDTPKALVRRIPRSWTDAWFDHALRQGIFDGPHIQLTWRESRVSLLGQPQKIHLETGHLSKSLPEPPRFPKLHCCSQEQTDQVGYFRCDETGVDVNTACAEEEEFSGHDFAQCGVPTLLAPISVSLFDFLPLLPLPLGIRTFV